MIDPIHGHGSQSLINLLITGKAVSNVWDNDKDISGLSKSYKLFLNLSKLLVNNFKNKVKDVMVKILFQNYSTK